MVWKPAIGEKLHPEQEADNSVNELFGLLGGLRIDLKKSCSLALDLPENIRVFFYC